MESVIMDVIFVGAGFVLGLWTAELYYMFQRKKKP